MNEQEFEIISRESKKQKLFDFAKKYKKIFFIFIIVIILFIIGYFLYGMYESNKRLNTANRFNNAVNKYETNNSLNIIADMEEIIKSKDKTYSPLALYYLIDNDLTNSNEDINKYFDTIIYDLGLKKDLVQLNLYKKVLFNADILSENELLSMIDPILNTENPWQSHSLYLLAEYYYSKGNKEKSLNYYKTIISKTNSNSDIKLEAQKRVQRDFSE